MRLVSCLTRIEAGAALELGERVLVGLRFDRERRTAWRRPGWRAAGRRRRHDDDARRCGKQREPSLDRRRAASARCRAGSRRGTTRWPRTRRPRAQAVAIGDALRHSAPDVLDSHAVQRRARLGAARTSRESRCSTAAGRAEMKYRETDDKSYRPSAGNLSARRRRGVRARPRPRPSPPRADRVRAASATPRATKAQREGQPRRRRRAGAVDRRRVLGESGADGDRRRRDRRRQAARAGRIPGRRHQQHRRADRDRARARSGRRRDRRRRARRMRIYTDSAYSIGVLSKGWKAKANQELIARMRRRLAGLPEHRVRQGLRPRRRPRKRTLRRAGASGGRTTRVEPRSDAGRGRCALVACRPSPCCRGDNKISSTEQESAASI